MASGRGLRCHSPPLLASHPGRIAKHAGAAVQVRAVVDCQSHEHILSTIIRQALELYFPSLSTEAWRVEGRRAGKDNRERLK
eukprot:scaffold900_cov36-Prasinocladus_malaysianus.AAC.1